MATKKSNRIVIICVGIPGSGKSTWAAEYVKKNPGFIRVNRDSWRFMLKDQPICEWKLESMISELQNETILKSLKNGYNVIVDNTNLKEKYIKDVIKLVETYADVDYMVFDVPAKTCIERDNLRDKKVGAEIINRMEKDYKNLVKSYVFQPQTKKSHSEDYVIPDFKSEKQDAVIFDVDGTLALMGRRGPFDWNKVDVDDPNQIVIEQVKFHRDKGRKILVLSGRDAVCKDMTSEWLNFYGVEFDEIFMRPEQDFRKDDVIKAEIYENHIKDKYNVLCVFDDRLKVVKMWYELGLFVFNCNQGNKDF